MRILARRPEATTAKRALGAPRSVHDEHDHYVTPALGDIGVALRDAIGGSDRGKHAAWPPSKRPTVVALPSQGVMEVVPQPAATAADAILVAPLRRVVAPGRSSSRKQSAAALGHDASASSGDNASRT
jgi:hypothetical protein